MTCHKTRISYVTAAKTQKLLIVAKYSAAIVAKLNKILTISEQYGQLSVADPGFPRGGGTNPKGGAPTYYLANFSRKLHENEEILGQRGGREGRALPLRSATGFAQICNNLDA